MTLREHIEDEIRKRGPIPFSRYMELCLYGEGGYYTSAREKFGKQGDFYTSSDVHAVFGRLLARQFEEMWRVLDQAEEVTVVELGPGRGLFAHDVLAWSQKMFPAFYASAALSTGGGLGRAAQPAGRTLRRRYSLRQSADRVDSRRNCA